MKQLGTRAQRVLLRRDQVLAELEIDEEQLEEFIDSKLLTEVRIRGHRRFDSDEVGQINSHRSVQMSRGGTHGSLRASKGTV